MSQWAVKTTSPEDVDPEVGERVQGEPRVATTVIELIGEPSEAWTVTGKSVPFTAYVVNTEAAVLLIVSS